MANSYLTRTPSGAGNRKTYTFSIWFKRSKLSEQVIFNSTGGGIGEIRLNLVNDYLKFVDTQSGSTNISYITNRLFRDTSAWYHLVLAVDTTQASSGNRVKIYINGEQETSFSSSTAPNEDYNTTWNTADIFQIASNQNPGDYFDGYMSHFAFVDGQQLAPTVFGETDSTSGIWKFKSPSGVTWGNNGFWLKFENSGALGTDSSGNSNTFTVNGNGRQALDTPTNVHATWNPLSSKVLGTVDWVLKDGNTNFDPGSNTNQFTMGTLCPAAGKWYWEMKSVQGSATDWPDLGIMFTDSISTHMALSNNPQHNFSYTVSLESNGTRWVTGTQSTSWVSGYANGDIIMIAVDVDAGKLWWGKNGSWFESANPASGNQAHAAWTAGTSITPWIEQYNTGEVQANFGNGYFGTTAISSAGSNGNGSLFEYDVPSGYYALNTKNINTYG